MSLFDCRAHLQSTYWHDDGQGTEHILQTKDGIIKQEILHIYSGLRLQSTKGAAPEGTSAHLLRLFKLGAANCSHIHALLLPEEHEETPEDHTQPSALQFLKAAVTSACEQSVFTNCPPRRPVIGVPQARVDPHGVALQVRHAGVPST